VGSRRTAGEPVYPPLAPGDPDGVGDALGPLGLAQCLRQNLDHLGVVVQLHLDGVLAQDDPGKDAVAARVLAQPAQAVDLRGHLSEYFLWSEY